MKKLIVVLVLLLSGCNKSEETNDVVGASDENTPRDVESVEDDSEESFEEYGEVNVFGESLIFYLDTDSSNDNLLQFAIEDVTYSFFKESIFILEEEFVPLEEYLARGEESYVLYELSTSDLPIDVTCNVDEKLWKEAQAEYNTLSGVTSIAEYGIYELGTQRINVKHTNDSGSEIAYGRSFQLQKLVNDVWRITTRNDGVNREFTAELIVIPDGSRWEEYYLEWVSFPLTGGKYRLVTEYTTSLNSDVYYFITEFEVKTGE